MFKFFKRKEVCIHDWHLVDAITVPDRIDGEDVYFVVVCPNCNREKNVRKEVYTEFAETFKVKTPS